MRPAPGRRCESDGTTVVILLLPVLFVPADVAAQANSTPADRTAEVHAVLDAFHGAISDHDLESLGLVMTPDFEALEWGMRLDKTAFEELLVRLAEDGAAFDLTMSDHNTVVLDEVAYSTVRSTDQNSGRAFFTLFILRKQDDRWLVARMTSTLEPRPGGSASSLSCGVVPEWEVEGASEPPEMLNRDEVIGILTRQFRRRGEGEFRAVLRMRVTREGRVDRACVQRASGVPAYDEAVVAAASLLQFRPATLNGEPRSTGVQIPFTVRIR